MTKRDLVAELEKRFILHNNQIFLRNNPEVNQLKTKKRITPSLVSSTIPSGNDLGQSNAVRRVLKKADEMESYFKNKDVDEYPKYAF